MSSNNEVVNLGYDSGEIGKTEMGRSFKWDARRNNSKKDIKRKSMRSRSKPKNR